MKKLLATAVAMLALQAHAGVIIDDTITGSVTNNFNALATGNVPGLIAQPGAMYGEHFSGQTVGNVGGLDTITGTPSSLTLQAAGATADNIGILFYGASNTIYGDLGGAIGEGVLSVLLDSGSSVFGLDVVGTNGGTFEAQFFAADGSLLGSISQGVTDRFYGFRATAGDLIYGITITNTDPGGIAYDNVTFNANAANDVPEPASLALFGLGMLGVAAVRRRKELKA